MKSWKTLLGLYQALIAVVTTIPIAAILHGLFAPSPNVSYRWDNVFLLLLIIVPTVVFCFCNAAKLLLPKRRLFEKWKSLNTISTVFTILWTCLFVFLLVFQTDWAGGRPLTAKLIAPQTRQAAPDLALNDQSGKTISLSTLKGKVVLLDFWGVWCGPCREKLPKTQDIHDEFKDKGLAVVGIHSNSRTEGMADFIGQENITFPIGIDPGHIADDYSVNAWPTYYLIDKQGRIAWGPQHGLPSERQIQSLLD